jgi:hypothetical protein
MANAKACLHCHSDLTEKIKKWGKGEALPHFRGCKIRNHGRKNDDENDPKDISMR